MFVNLEEGERGNVRTTLTRAKEGIIHKMGRINFLPSLLFRNYLPFRFIFFYIAHTQ
jgi:hypothetical protein